MYNLDLKFFIKKKQLEIIDLSATNSAFVQGKFESNFQSRPTEESKQGQGNQSQTPGFKFEE